MWIMGFERPLRKQSGGTLRMTHHNGRTRADGSAFSAKHNDRNGFTADHITPDPEHDNFYRTINPVTQKPIKLGEDGTLQSIAMGRGTVLDYVKPEAQAVVDDLNELDNEEYEL